MCIWFSGSKLSEHQESPGSYLSDCGWHDKGQDSRGDSQNFQYQKWFYTGGRGGGAAGEPVGLWVKGQNKQSVSVVI